jgi:Mg-chelatase subunit ChlD
MTSEGKGRYVFYEFPKRRPWDIAFSPTIRAAAPYQVKRRPGGLFMRIEPQDIRVKVREIRAPLTVVLLIDMSLSMNALLENVREAVLSIRESVHRRRDRVGLVIFKGSDATVIQYPTTNLDLIVKKLLRVGVSDFTPMAAGMLKAFRILQNEKRRNKSAILVLVIISDGIVNVPLAKPISPLTRKRFLNPSQADVIDVAHLLAKEKIRTVVVNPDHHPEDLEPEGRGRWWKDRQGLCPAALLLEIPRITVGRYYGISEGGKIQTIILKEAITTPPSGNFL